MKKILCSIMILLLTISITGCDEIVTLSNVDIERTTVKVKVVNQYHQYPHGSYAYSPMTGKFEYVCIPGTYLITVEYQGEQYEFSGMSTYQKYKDKVGKYVNGILQTKKYEDGTTSQKIVDLE